MTDRRRAPIEMLERLAEASLEVDRIAGRAAIYGGGELGNALQCLHKAQDSYRAAVAPLPPPDLARLLRRLHVETQRCNACVAGECDWHDLQRVVRAFTTLSEDAQAAAYDEANSGPSSADTEEVPSPRPPVSPAGGLFFDEDLIRRAMDPTVPPGHMRLIISRGAVDVLIEPSGPAGVAAAKESKDNAAAPEGAANDRDQALHLERRIGDAVRAIRRSSTIPAGLLHELLGILEGEA